MPERELTPGRYAIDRNGRLYSCRGPWRRNAVAIVTIRRRPDHLTDSERKRLVEIERLPAPPCTVLPDSLDDRGRVRQVQLKDAASKVRELPRSTARFKPMGLRSEDDDAAAAYARAAEASSRD